MIGRILVIDDSLTYREELAEQLRDEGCVVVTAASGEEGLLALERETVDAVCVDMILPGLSGQDVCRQLRAEADTSALPIIMLTSREGTGPMQEALAAGANDFVCKTDDLVVLTARLQSLLRKRQMEEEQHRVNEELALARVEAASARGAREQAEMRARLLADLEVKNAELEQAKNRAEAAVQLRDEFIIVASHELKTPLTALRLQLESALRMMHRETGAISERVVAKLETGRRHMDRFAILIDGLLDATRISAGELKLQYQGADLTEVVRQLIERLRPEARRANMAIELNTPGPLPGHWDVARLDQILAHVLSNALKYGDGKDIVVDVVADGDCAEVKVCDHGIGVPEEQREQIFERFGRRVPVRNYGGFGLGLYLTRKLVEAHGGTIRVVSSGGIGATFILRLPLEPGAPLHLQSPQPHH